MKKITRDELDIILKKHKLWLKGNEEGEQANLYGIDLRGVDLRGVNLERAYLHGANLEGAYLYGANLCEADLRRAHLERAYLYGATLCEANLCEADLRRADLRRVNLCDADLRGAKLEGAYLEGVYLEGISLEGAEKCVPIACPEKGSFIAFKKARGYIVELLILEDARRCSATSRKCRCDKAKVISITNISGESADIDEIASDRDINFVYHVGEYVEVKDFNENRWEEYSAGIHFFVTRQEAADY